VNKYAWCVGEGRVYGQDFRVLTEDFIASLVQEGVPEEDLRVMASQGFVFCVARHSFIKFN